ncbi:MAG: hypothetical protein HC777_01100 [Hyphomonadaceae bacterium]|nr:hypothetical protein [Hyphomonadaceae bacterium]
MLLVAQGLFADPSSENILQLHNAYIYGASVAVIGEALRALYRNDLPAKLAFPPLIAAAVMICVFNLDITYVRDFYADNASALLIMTLVSILFISGQRIHLAAVILAASCVVTGKLNLYPLAGVIVFMWAFARGYNWLWAGFAAFMTLVLVGLEYVFFGLIAPDRLVIPQLSDLVRFELVTLDAYAQRFFDAFQSYPINEWTGFVVLALLLLQILFSLFCSAIRKLLFIIVAVELCFISFIVSLIMLLDIGLVNSLARYFQTIYLLGALSLILIVATLLRFRSVTIRGHSVWFFVVGCATGMTYLTTQAWLDEHLPFSVPVRAAPFQPDLGSVDSLATGHVRPARLYLVPSETGYADRHWNTAFRRRRWQHMFHFIKSILHQIRQCHGQHLRLR